MAHRRTRREILRWQGALGVAALGGCGRGARQDALPAPGSPHASGFVKPIEAARHERTFMQWPALPTKGDPLAARELQRSVARIARAVAKFEPVVMIGASTEAERIGELVGDAAAHWRFPTNDLWCRNSGPTFVLGPEGALGVADLNFNGYGGRRPHGFDAKIAHRIAEETGAKHFDSGLVGEGGGVETDGAGTLIAHESSWLGKSRNGRDREAVEKMLLDALGAEKMIWAPGYAGGDLTDFHVDALARFISPGRVLVQLPERRNDRDPRARAAFETYEILKTSTDANGAPLEIVAVAEPRDIRSSDENFVASYVNYYVCNDAVIAAQFGDDKADVQARATLEYLYPGREVVMVDVDPIAAAGGGVHCATQQQPAAGV